MKALNITKTVVKILGASLMTVLSAAFLPIFVIFTSLKGEKAEPKPHILCTYRYIQG